MKYDQRLYLKNYDLKMRISRKKMSTLICLKLTTTDELNNFLKVNNLLQ